MRVRKLIVNTFIREIVLFEDRIVITYNFKNNTDTGRHTPETVEKLLNEVDSAYTTEIGSSISLSSEPKKNHTNQVRVVLFAWLQMRASHRANLFCKHCRTVKNA